MSAVATLGRCLLCPCPCCLLLGICPAFSRGPLREQGVHPQVHHVGHITCDCSQRQDGGQAITGRVDAGASQRDNIVHLPFESTYRTSLCLSPDLSDVHVPAAKHLCALKGSICAAPSAQLHEPLAERRRDCAVLRLLAPVGEAERDAPTERDMSFGCRAG